MEKLLSPENNNEAEAPLKPKDVFEIKEGVDPKIIEDLSQQGVIEKERRESSDRERIANIRKSMDEYMKSPEEKEREERLKEYSDLADYHETAWQMAQKNKIYLRKEIGELKLEAKRLGWKLEGIPAENILDKAIEKISHFINRKERRRNMEEYTAINEKITKLTDMMHKYEQEELSHNSKTGDAIFEQKKIKYGIKDTPNQLDEAA